MITREVIDGRPVVVSYINDVLEPVSADDATMIKVTFHDGEVRFGLKSAQDQLRSKWARVRARARGLLAKGDFIRDPATGQFQGSHPGPGHGSGEGGDEGIDDDDDDVSDLHEAIAAWGTKSADAVKNKWSEESPIKDIDRDVVPIALEVQERFAAAAEAVAAKTGVAFKNPGPKTHGTNKLTGKLEFRQEGVDRMKEKIATKGYKTAARVTDAVRGAFVVNSPGDVKKVANEMAKTHDLIVEHWRTVGASHYTDRAATFRDRKTGLLGEIQFLEPRLLAAKDREGGGHSVYKQVEALERIDKNHPGIKSLNEKMQGIYGKVLDEFHREGKGWEKIDRRRRR